MHFDSAVGMSPWSLTLSCHSHCGISKKCEYLDKIKIEFENILPDYQGPRWVQIMKQNRGLKSRDTLPLSCNFLFVSGTYGIKESCLEI